MTSRGKKRLYVILLMLLCLGGAVALTMVALRDNISFFYSPHEIKAAQIYAGREFRLGGMVKDGSLQPRDKDMVIRFIVTDMQDDMPVEYAGILPDLFREGQGVVAKGQLDTRGIFIARELLAKHDENYMPPEVARSLKKANPQKTNSQKTEPRP